MIFFKNWTRLNSKFCSENWVFFWFLRISRIYKIPCRRMSSYVFLLTTLPSESSNSSSIWGLNLLELLKWSQNCLFGRKYAYGSRIVKHCDRIFLTSLAPSEYHTELSMLRGRQKCQQYSGYDDYLSSAMIFLESFRIFFNFIKSQIHFTTLPFMSFLFL